MYKLANFNLKEKNHFTVLIDKFNSFDLYHSRLIDLIEKISKIEISKTQNVLKNKFTDFRYNLEKTINNIKSVDLQASIFFSNYTDYTLKISNHKVIQLCEQTIDTQESFNILLLEIEEIFNYIYLNQPNIIKKDEVIKLETYEKLELHISTLLTSSNKASSTSKKIKDLFNEIVFETNNSIFGFSSLINEKYEKKFLEETEVLLKKIQNGSNELLAKHAHEVKKIQNDYSSTLNDYKILKDSFTQLEKHHKDVQNKLLSYEKELNKIQENNNTEIKTRIENGLIDASKIYMDKIKTIDNTYNNALKNYESFTKLVQNAGIYKLTENYNKKAIDEQDEYKKFRKYTSNALYAAIIFTAIILLIPVIQHWGDETPINAYFTILARLTISLMFFVLALYFSKQAAKHYECYQENHRTFLQLAALEPFMANMEPNDQLNVRKELIPVYFNQNSDGKFAAKSEEIALPEAFKNLPDKIVEAINSRMKPPSNS
ncbi:hypothetical protein [Acinetobacter sp. A47]|uniref:hypothetical protein n=1 Tax=Acinetobacter sp. A47 TaxID=1561217 RepID=UPI00056EA816|nr:hypothetical protein [Acinetobacter sp. A47]